MDQSNASTALVLGILSLLLPILGPFAWRIGATELKAIDDGSRPPENRATANTGRILGIVTTIILAAAFTFVGFGLIVYLINRNG